MALKTVTVSLVIPAYNEEDYLKACLEAIARQTKAPKEVIVVDNNSTDRTRAIARSYPFVRVVSEKRQGQVFAQATGFDLVTADIMGRIDADSRLPTDWVERVAALFAKSPDTVAFTGAPAPYDMPFPRVVVAAFQLYHDVLTTWTAGHHLPYGTNCAFRAALWPQIKPSLHLRTGIWEDYDLGFVLAGYGNIVWVPSIAVGCSFRKFNEPYLVQLRYFWQAVNTFRLHASWWRVGLQAVVRASIALYLPFVLINRLKRG